MPVVVACTARSTSTCTTVTGFPQHSRIKLNCYRNVGPKKVYLLSFHAMSTASTPGGDTSCQRAERASAPHQYVSVRSSKLIFLCCISYHANAKYFVLVIALSCFNCRLVGISSVTVAPNALPGIFTSFSSMSREGRSPACCSSSGCSKRT